MPTAIAQKPGIIKNGTCPHGMIQGACPICSGMGGGLKRADHTAKPGEMSWNECAAIGAMLRAQKNAKQLRQQDTITFAQKIAQFEKSMSNISQKLTELANNINSKFPPILAKPVNFILNKLTVNTINIIKNIPNTIQSLAQNISQKFTEIADKLTAIYGETKAAIAKKFGEPIEKFKKKIKSIFEIFNSQNTDNEEKQMNEAKKAFELKTFIHDLYKKIKEG